MCLILRTLSRS
ncbi:hypothetical protein Zm00014a_033650 [Zea mays]|uniref:Uncharacterized protein n=1 Tax=Zea mays TaxID=4577 RepID=A0A3L6FFY1_MAIZE|nr:hypothetical protein Zm00014a_033650 [Zea mays]